LLLVVVVVPEEVLVLLVVQVLAVYVQPYKILVVAALWKRLLLFKRTQITLQQLGPEVLEERLIIQQEHRAFLHHLARFLQLAAALQLILLGLHTVVVLVVDLPMELVLADLEQLIRALLEELVLALGVVLVVVVPVALVGLILV
jgi:hypothetical protein